MQLISIGQFHKVIEKYLYWLSLPSIGFTDILEIIIISVIVYQMLKWVQLTRAWTLFKGIIMLLLFALFAAIFQLNTISFAQCWNYSGDHYFSAGTQTGIGTVRTEEDLQ